MKTKYEIAELVVEMEPRYTPLQPQAEAYRTETKQDALHFITVEEERYRWYAERYQTSDFGLIEYMDTGSTFYNLLLDHDGLLLHASAVELDGKAYLFSAPSGTGKSTHTTLWLRNFPDAKILNDDKPAIRLFPNGIFVYGTPWSGKTDLSRNQKVPLQGITFLSRGQENRIEPMSSLQAIQSILEQTVRPQDAQRFDSLLKSIERLIQEIPIFQMECNMDPDAAILSHKIMTGGYTK